MLSAIAARKAAQAAKPRQLAQDDTNESSNAEWKEASTPMLTSEHEDLLEIPVTSDSEAATPRKRKARQDAPRKLLQKRTKKKLPNVAIGRPRYFEAEQPIEGFDSDNILRSEISQSPRPHSRGYSPSQPIHNSSQEDGLISGFLTEDVNQDPDPGPCRGFSPSRPLLDSSEEEGDGEELKKQELYSPDKNIETGSGVSLTASRRPFVPRLGLNCFRLTSDDIKNLDISPLDVGSVSGTLIILPPGHSLTFVGAASITLLKGIVAVLGTPLRPSLHSHRVFSPRSNPLASIEALDVSSVGRECDSRGSNERCLPHRVQNAVNASSSVVIIRPLMSGVESLGKVCRVFDGVFNVDLDVRDTDAEDAIDVEGFHPVNPHSRPHPLLQPFLMPESWDKTLESAVPSLSSLADIALPSESRSFVALIKGPKKCGKSTFARTLLNRLTTRYRRVAFLECDLGQSEFTPGGMVALHIVSKPVFGPPFTHPTIPHRAHYIGHSTPRSSPSHYLACIRALVQNYRMDVQYAYQETLSSDDVFDEEGAQENLLKEADDRSEFFIPLVVNTQGWIKGLGGDLLRQIEEIVDATDIFDLDAQSATFPPQRSQRIHSSNTRLHTIQPILSSPLTTYYTAADYRSLSILSYFHSFFPPRGREVTSWLTDLPLCARAPWELEAVSRFVLVGAGFEDVIPEELGYALNCGLVALVCEEDSTLHPSVAESDNSESSWLYTQGAPAPSPSTSHCLGLALIRGVNSATHTLHFLTPVSPTEFPKCHVLVKGELELPVWGMLDFRDGQDDGVAGIKWGKVPYLQMGGDEPGAIGSSKRRVRKNLMRRGQII